MSPQASRPSESRRHDTHRREHAACFACGTATPPLGCGLGLDFHVDDDASGVAADWICPPSHASYPGTAHGGILATLLDSAMVHALFALGLVAHTAELRVRYFHPVSTDAPLRITARVRRHFGRLHDLEGEIHQHNRRCVRAEAKFMSLARSA